MLKKVLAIGLVVVSGFVVSNAHAAGWGNSVTITNFFPQASGPFVLTTSSNQNPDSRPNNHYLFIDSADANFTQLAAAVMEAYVSGATVTLYYNSCLNGYPAITSVAVGGIW